MLKSRKPRLGFFTFTDQGLILNKQIWKMIKLCTTWTVVNCNVQSAKLFLCLFCFRENGNSELQPFNPYLKVFNSRAVFSKSKTLSYDIHILAQTCIKQIQDTRSTCHQAENSEKFGWRVNVKVIFSEIPTKHSEHLRLRFEVVQSFRLVWTKQTVAYHLPFTAFKSCAFYIRAFFYNIQTVRFSGALKKVSYMPLSGVKYPRERTAQYWLLSVFL